MTTQMWSLFPNSFWLLVKDPSHVKKRASCTPSFNLALIRCSSLLSSNFHWHREQLHASWFTYYRNDSDAEKRRSQRNQHQSSYFSTHMITFLKNYVSIYELLDVNTTSSSMGHKQDFKHWKQDIRKRKKH